MKSFSVKLGVIFIGLIIFGYGCSIVNIAYAQSTLALQEKCAEGAKKWFFEHINFYGGKWGTFSNEEGFWNNNFESHYNRKHDKCFIKITWSFFPKDKDQESMIGTDIFDVFESKRIGQFSQSWKGSEKGLVISIFEDRELVPIFQADKVNPIVERQKFDALIKPYMEE
jgi:hypothetical protein